MLTRGMEEAVAEANGLMCLVGPAFLLTSFCFLNCRSGRLKNYISQHSLQPGLPNQLGSTM